MKCPKCSYLGFETGDRCRNCGYDFSLISHGDAQPIDMDLELRSAHSDAAAASDWPIRAEATLPPPIHSGVSAPKVRPSRGSKLPLFTSADRGDEPLIRLPVTPRPPLAVRRTRQPAAAGRVESSAQRWRASPRSSSRTHARHRTVRTSPRSRRYRLARARRKASRCTCHPQWTADPHGRCRHRPRAASRNRCRGDLLHVTHFGTDNERGALPALPLLAFLLLLKLAQLSAFTAVGGQTIGKNGSAHSRRE